MIYISGATGHIGNNTARYLLSQGLPVTLLIRSVQPSIASLNVPMIQGNLFSDDFLDALLHPGDLFIHLAGVIAFSKRDYKKANDVNVKGTQTIVEACIRHQTFLIYASSVDAINKPLNQGIIAEPMAFEVDRLKSIYSKSKAIGTAMVLDAFDKKLLKGAIIYPSAVIGVHDYKPSAAGLQLYKASKHWILPCIRGGYNFIDVLDCAKAIHQIIIHKIEGSFILAAHEKSLVEVYHTIQRLTNKRKWMIPIPLVMAYIGSFFLKNVTPTMIDALQENYHYDHSKMISILNVEPTPFDETVKATIEWFEKNNQSSKSR